LHAKTAARCEPQFLFLHEKFGYGGQKTDKKEAVIITISKGNALGSVDLAVLQ